MIQSVTRKLPPQKPVPVENLSVCDLVNAPTYSGMPSELAERIRQAKTRKPVLEKDIKNLKALIRANEKNGNEGAVRSLKKRLDQLCAELFGEQPEK